MHRHPVHGHSRWSRRAPQFAEAGERPKRVEIVTQKLILTAIPHL